METPRKFTITKLSIRKLRSSSVAIVYSLYWGFRFNLAFRHKGQFTRFYLLDDVNDSMVMLWIFPIGRLVSVVKKIHRQSTIYQKITSEIE